MEVSWACVPSAAIVTQDSHPCSRWYQDHSSPSPSPSPLPLFLNLLSVYILICALEILTLPYIDSEPLWVDDCVQSINFSYDAFSFPFLTTFHCSLILIPPKSPTWKLFLLGNVPHHFKASYHDQKKYILHAPSSPGLNKMVIKTISFVIFIA